MKARRTKDRLKTRKIPPRTPPTSPRQRHPKTAIPKGFVGRDGSPVLDRYPPKDPSLLVKGPPPGSVPARTTPPPPPPAGAGPKSTPAATGPAVASPGAGPAAVKMLIALEKPFDVDEFAQLLGETNIRANVPREDLPEILRRICDFMGFGIYVYSFRVRPAPSDLLKEFVLELQRVDFSTGKGDWVPFVERGRSDSPFGPDGQR